MRSNTSNAVTVRRPRAISLTRPCDNSNAAANRPCDAP